MKFANLLVTKPELGLQTLYVHDWTEGVDLYRHTGETGNPEEMVSHDDSILLDGAFRPVEEDSTVDESRNGADY